MWQIHSIWVEVWSSGMTGAKSQKALIYNPGSSKDLCGLNVLVFLLNRNKKKGQGRKEKKSQCFLHTSYSYCKTNKELHNCGPGRFAILCSSNMQHNHNPRLLWWTSRSGHFACHSTVHALHASLIKPEWLWLHVPIFCLKALRTHLLGSYQLRRCEAQSCTWEAIPRGQGIHTEQKRTITC